MASYAVVWMDTADVVFMDADVTWLDWEFEFADYTLRELPSKYALADLATKYGLRPLPPKYKLSEN